MADPHFLWQVMKIAIVGHFSRLMPLLIAWNDASDLETRSAAKELLADIADLTWPRTGYMYSMLAQKREQRDSTSNNSVVSARLNALCSTFQ